MVDILLGIPLHVKGELGIVLRSRVTGTMELSAALGESNNP
jgi:hypothetical protein